MPKAGNAISKFGERVRQVREKLGLSAPKFAATIGFDRSYLHRVESGEAANPSLKFIEAVVMKFGVDREWLVGGTKRFDVRTVIEPQAAGTEPKLELPGFLNYVDTLSNDELVSLFKYVADQRDKGHSKMQPLYKSASSVLIQVLTKRFPPADGSAKPPRTERVSRETTEGVKSTTYV